MAATTATWAASATLTQACTLRGVGRDSRRSNAPSTAKSSNSFAGGRGGLLKRSGLSGKVLRQFGSQNGSAFVMNLDNFSEQESVKFRSDLIQLLEANNSNPELHSKIADVCTAIFKEYASSYSGEFLPEPFAKMKEALAKEGIPEPEKAVVAAVGWARSNLYPDWKKFSSAK